MTTSIGVAIYPLNGKDSDEMLTLADRLLYQAKHAGRNWIMVAE